MTKFFPPVVITANNNIISVLLATPLYVLCVGVTSLNAWYADTLGELYLHVTLPLWACIAHLILVATIRGKAP
jgi:hypothetical protein